VVVVDPKASIVEAKNLSAKETIVIMGEKK
jgi:hypothetical protein